MSVSLEQRLATFRKAHKAPSELPRTAPAAKENDVPDAPARTNTPEPARLSSSGLLRTVGEVEDTLYHDFVESDKRVVLIYVAMWAILFFTAISFEFGAVYFVLSILYSLWKFGLRQRKQNEASAYSVFNPGVAPIQGSQLTGEQMRMTMGIR